MLVVVVGVHLCMCVYGSVCEMYGSVPVYVRTCVHVCMYGCVCVRMCVCVCACVRARMQ